MTGIEYKVVPAPRRARARKGARSAPDALARAIQDLIAEEARQGWEYLRADLIPCEERKGFLSRRTEMHRAMLVFRRGAAAAVSPVPEPRREAPRFDPRPAPEEPLELHGGAPARDHPHEPLPFRPLGSAND